MAEDWALKPHTEAKHQVLRHYLGAWFAIMAEGGMEKRYVFLDGFAGRGRYTGGEPGSPLVALKVLLDHPFFPRWADKEFPFVLVEPNGAHFANLEAELDALWAARPGGKPPNIKVLPFNTTFEDAAQEILKQLGGKHLAPTFALIDPFGWKGLPMDVIAKLLAYPKCEVFVNFMLDHVRRFVEGPDVQESVRSLFGTTVEHLPPPGLTPAQRQEFLIELYRQQLKAKAKFKYVTNFEMIDARNKPLYHLFYGTRSLTGLDKMKQAMWKVDPGGGVRFSDRLAGALVLFGEKPDPGPLLKELRGHFAGKTVTVEQVRDYVIENTPYTSSHYNRPVLNPLEKADLIKVVASSRKKRFTFPPGTKIHFL